MSPVKSLHIACVTSRADSELTSVSAKSAESLEYTLMQFLIPFSAQRNKLQ